MHWSVSPTATIASRTPWSSLVSWCAHPHAEGVAVERDRLVEVGHGDADVVDAHEQVRGDLRRSWPAIVVRGRASAARDCDLFLTPVGGTGSSRRPPPAG